jgi:hypothetical protein
MFTTSQPIPLNVEITIELTIGPEIRASRPTTTLILSFPAFFFAQVAYEAVNLTTSSGLKPSPGFPPIVPRIPEIDFIKVTFLLFVLSW